MDWSLSDSSRYASAGTAESSAGGTVTAHTSVNTYGAYSHVPQPLSFDADNLWIKTKVHKAIYFTGERYFLFDVAAGTPGAETTLISGVPLYSDGMQQYGNFYHLPVAIPKGTDLSFRTQSNGSGNVMKVSFMFSSHGLANFASFSKMRSYGANSSTSRTTIVSSGVVANTKGAWAQVTASTQEDIAAVLIILSDETNTVGLNSQQYLMDIGLGPAGQERIVIPDLYLIAASTSTYVSPSTIGPLKLSIPKGSRIAVRAQCTNTNALQNPIGVVIIGFSR